MTVKTNPFLGTWSITEMDQWDEDVINEIEPAQISFTKDGGGSMQFIAVQLELDWRQTEREGSPALEFTFEGNDEMDRVSGAGWVRLEGADELEGWFKFHQGDDSGFSAEREKTVRHKKSAGPRRARRTE